MTESGVELFSHMWMDGLDLFVLVWSQFSGSLFCHREHSLFGFGEGICTFVSMVVDVCVCV